MKHLLILLLLIPFAAGLQASSDLYVPGDLIHLTGINDSLTVTTPTGSYTQIGTSNELSFPASRPGIYRFSTSEETLSITVSPGVPLRLRTAKGASSVTAAQTPEGLRLSLPGFTRVLLDTNGTEVRITPNMGRRWGFAQTYAVDPTAPGFTSATLTRTAQGSSLHKCDAYNYTEQTCEGAWRFVRTLTPGEEYTLTVTGADPVFGEADSESEPDSCTFSDAPGAGDGDSGADCLTEVLTQDAGTTADLTDSEDTPDTSQIDVRFQNSLSVASINSVSVTYRYQRLPNSEVADTTATVQVLDGGVWTTACTDIVSIGSWDAPPCDLSAYVTTEAEANDIQTRVLFDTGKAAKPSSFGTVYVDHAYLAMDYVYDDRYAPTYTAYSATPASPKTYDGLQSTFNSTWTDDVAVTEVRLEHDFDGILQNTTVSGAPYSHSRVLGAGSYTWRYLARDAAGNWNDTMPWQSYTVVQASGSVELLLNGTRGDLSIDEDQSITLTGNRLAGETTMQLYEDGAEIASGTSISLPRTYTEPGTYTLTLNMSATQNYTAGEEEWTLTVRDTTPPAGVTNLQNTSAGEAWIAWSWTNPLDSDFSHTEVWINGTFRENTTASTYNATGLSSDALYEIQLRTTDTAGNTNQTWVVDEGRTAISLDTTPPVISGVQSSGVADSQVTINWTTDEPADSLVKYGTTSGSYSQTSYSSTDETSHSRTLTSLSPNTDYYYVVNSTDAAGNSAESAEYTFTTSADSTPPTYEAVEATPGSGATYPVTATFNTTWNDNGAFSTAQIEHNFTGTLTNDTMTASGNVWSYTTPLAAGTYRWRSIGTDSEGNTNATMAYQTYTVVRADGQVNLLLDGADADASADEDTSVTLRAERDAGEGNLALYEDGVLLTSGTPPLQTIKNYTEPGTYNITAVLAQTQNYTAAQETHWLTINDTTPPEVTLVEPFDGRTDTDGTITFSYIPNDNVATASCSLFINGSAAQTNNTITDGATNSFTHTLTDGQYAWSVQCSDAAGNTYTTQNRELAVAIIHPWIPTTATHNLDGDVTAAVNETGGGTARLDLTEFVTATAWSRTAPTNANISAVEATCELATASGGAAMSFQYSTGGAFSGDLCTTPTDGTGPFVCDLYAQGIDTVAELNALQLRCVVRDSDGGPKAVATLDYMEVQPDWTLIELPDFQINDTSLTFPVAPKENEAVTLRANVTNEGVVGASATVRFTDETRAAVLGESTQTIGAGGWAEFTQAWNAPLGQTNISVRVDPAGTVTELDENNNEASGLLNVSSWQRYYGSTVKKFLALGDGASIKYNWTNEDLSGHIFVTDADADVTMLNLAALTYEDLAEADAALGSTAFPDSINRTYAALGSLKETQTFTVFGNDIAAVPVVNSTTSAAFVTGLLYDADDDTGGGYDGEEDLVLITRINRTQTGSYGTYDYELRVPALLRNLTGSTDIVELFIEIT